MDSRRTFGSLGPAAWGAAWGVLSLPAAAEAAEAVGVVPILIGPLQVFLAILPAILVALGGALLSMLKPSAMKALGKLLWKKKVPTGIFVAVVVGGVYLLSSAFGGSGAEAGKVELGSADWPAFRGGIERRGAVAGHPDPAERAVVWSYAYGKVKCFYSSPAVVGNRVYISSADKGVFSDRGGILCLDAETAALVWDYSPRGFKATYSSPAATDKYVVCGEGLHFTREARVTCLDAASGERLWELRTGSHVESSPCIYEDKVYIGAGDDGMYCIALAPSGGGPRQLWHLDGKKYPDCETSPIVHDGKVYFGLGEGGCAVVCVEAETGKEIWRTPAPYPVFGSPTLTDGKLFVGMGNGNLIESAEVVREKKIKRMRDAGAAEAEIAEKSKNLGPAGEVWCLNPADGSVVWKFQMGRTILGTLAGADGRIYFGSRDGKFYCMTTDRQPVGRPFDAHEPIVTSPAVGAENVYFVTETGRLYCLDRRTLKRVWDMPVGTAGPFLSSPAVARGHVYVGTTADGFLCVGKPADTSRVPAWAGALGGSGRGGWADGSALPERGARGWRHPRTTGTETAAVGAPPACLGGAVYAGITAGKKTGLAKLISDPQARGRRRAAKELWFYPTANPIRRSAAVRGGHVFVVDGQEGDAGRKLHCIRAADGQGLWQRPVAPAAGGELLLDGERLYATIEADKLTCIELSSDPADAAYEVRWSQPVAAPVGAPAPGGKDVLVVSASSGSLVALNGDDGRQEWAAALPAKPTTGCIRVEDLVAVGTEAGAFVLSDANGAALWSAPVGPVAGTLTGDEDHLAFATAGGVAYVFTWTGRQVLRVEKAAAGIAPMLVGDQAVCLVEGNFDRFDLDSGERRRWYSAAWLGEITTAPVLADSHLYFGTAEKGLVCAQPRK